MRFTDSINSYAARKGARPGGEIDPWSECASIAKRHYENFTVGSLLLPKALRKHIRAVYAYCRTVDDLGDEADGDRLGLLDAWEKEFRAALVGRATHPIMRALQETIRTFELSEEPFLQLIEANRRDQFVHRYATFDDLLGYCRLSANPVGRIVLALFGCDTPENRTLSDATCTALQLTNFWQDIRRDLSKGRIYLPLDDMERFGCSEEDLRSGIAHEGFRRLLAFEVERTRKLFALGETLVERVPPRLSVDVALFGMGGRAILDAIEAQDYDVLSRRPTLSRFAKLRLLRAAALAAVARRYRPERG